MLGPLLVHCLLAGFVLIGLLSLFVYLFNRLNATGWPRKSIKLLEKVLSLVFVIGPLLVMVGDRTWLWQWLSSPSVIESSWLGFGDASWAMRLLTLIACLSLLWQTPSWIRARPRAQGHPRQVELEVSRTIDAREVTQDRVFAKAWVRLLGGVPGNQLHLIQANQHAIYLPQSEAALSGLRIGHLSDLHLTGYMHREYYRTAVAQLMAMQPELVILSGDLIDYDACLPQVCPLLQPISAPLGCFFVLGNHDRRLQRVAELRQMLVELGWHDLGQKSAAVERRGAEIYLIGNERPWFDAFERQRDEERTTETRRLASLRIGVSHSPDQWPWASRLGCDLLFCGHTHGGQVRLPGIGPIIAPSWYGSRYASGWFLKEPTLMHVSRGLSGTHPLRFGCPPEVSVCILNGGRASHAS
jgi:predicted MPP superfamily phosphohydrolase